MAERRAVTSSSDSHQAGFVEAVVPVLVTDDEVIEQGQVEHVGGGAQPQREPRVVWTRRRIGGSDGCGPPSGRSFPV